MQISSSAYEGRTLEETDGQTKELCDRIAATHIINSVVPPSITPPHRRKQTKTYPSNLRLLQSSRIAGDWSVSLFGPRNLSQIHQLVSLTRLPESVIADLPSHSIGKQTKQTNGIFCWKWQGWSKYWRKKATAYNYYATMISRTTANMMISRSKHFRVTLEQIRIYKKVMFLFRDF